MAIITSERAAEIRGQLCEQHGAQWLHHYHEAIEAEVVRVQSEQEPVAYLFTDVQSDRDQLQRDFTYMKQQRDALQAKCAGLEHVKNAFELQMLTLQAKLDSLQTQEPVGFVAPHDLKTLREGYPATVVMLPGNKRTEPLYAAPKALEPITDERQPLTKVLAAVREYLPPDGITAKDCLTKIIAIVDPWPLNSKPLIAMKDVELSLMAHNDDPGDWNDLRYRDCWHEGYKAGARATEAAHGITKGTP